MDKDYQRMDAESLLTVTEAAYRLKRTPKTIYRYVEQGLLEKVKIGGSTFILLESVKKMLSPQKA